MATTYVSLDDTLRQMKAELRREFPGTKFSIRRARGTAYGYVDVSWTDGPTVADVEHITNGYEGQGFDGMTDSSYRIDHVSADASGNPVTVRYGTRGISCRRAISPVLANQCIAQIVAFWGGISSAPQAIADGWGEYRLTPDMGHAAIRPDLDWNRNNWHSEIRRCAERPDEFTR